MNIRPEITDLSIDITTVTPHPRNIRQGDVGAICQSLAAHGQYRPIVVQRSTGHVLAGNHTLAAARSLGWSEIAATYVECDDEQALRILLVDNRANDLATYDDALLAELLLELSHSTESLTQTLYTGDDLDDLLFRLNGDLGAGHVGESISDLKDIYADKNTRSIVLPFDLPTYETVTAKCADLRKHYHCDTNSKLIEILVNRDHENR